MSAILFGGRRSELVPLVCEAFSWEHGVLLGAMMKVETTAAADGAIGRLREDPMAMRPFCGYNMGDYFQHWLDFSRTNEMTPPQRCSRRGRVPPHAAMRRRVAVAQTGGHRRLTEGHVDFIIVLEGTIVHICGADDSPGVVHHQRFDMGHRGPVLEEVDASRQQLACDAARSSSGCQGLRRNL